MTRVLVLSSLFTTVFAIGIILLATYLLLGKINSANLITAISIGLTSGVTIFLTFRHQNIKSCKK